MVVLEDFKDLRGRCKGRSTKVRLRLSFEHEGSLILRKLWARGDVHKLFPWHRPIVNHRLDRFGGGFNQAHAVGENDVRIEWIVLCELLDVRELFFTFI